MKHYFDPRLLLFSALAGGASIISAHGAFVFFGYLVDPWLAWTFTIVLALGIIGLDAAATVERSPIKRAAYLGGMALFLAMEVLANYFSSQATFVEKVVAKLPASADLRSLAVAHPHIGRGLVVLFLSLASIAVACFVFAAASRAAQLGGVVRQLRRPRQLRTLIRTLARQLRTARATLRTQGDQLRTAEREVREQSAAAARISAEAAAQSAAATLDVRAIAQALRDSGVPLRTIGAALGVSEKTIRNWTADVRTNGHLVEG